MTASEELELTGKSSQGVKCTVCLRTPTAPFQVNIVARPRVATITSVAAICNCSQFSFCSPLPLQENGVWYVLWSMHSSQHELRHALANIRPAAVEPICGRLSGTVSELVNSSNLMAAKARLDAYATQAAAQQAAQDAAASKQAATAAAPASAASRETGSATFAAAEASRSRNTPQHRRPADSHAAPDHKAVPMPRSADVMQAAADSGNLTGNMHAVRMSAAPCAASLTNDPETTAPEGREPSNSDSQQPCVAATRSCIGMHAANGLRNCSRLALGAGSHHEADGSAAPTGASSHCTPPTSTAATGKENASPSLPLKRAAPAAECAVMPRPVRQALTVSTASSSCCEHAQPPERKPAVTALDSITMSDAFINLDCLD